MRKTVLGTFLAAEALLVLFLSGCGATFDFAGLRQMEPEGDGFTVNAFGEARPRVSPPDGMREPRNRRAEVTVAPASTL